MNPAQQKANAKKFVERWLNEPGNEEEQSRSFWIQLLEEILGVPNATHVLQFERKVKGRKIDVFYEDMGILIEQKGRGISLDEVSIRSKKAGAETPYQQARWYADNLPFSIRPRWVVTCNFDEIRIYDQDKEDPDQFESILLKDLAEEYHRLSFFTDKKHSRIEREKQLSVQAGEIVGKLYAQLSAQYKNIETDEREQYSLNVLIVRLVFLLYAEDAELLQRKDAFLDYMKQFESHQMRSALISLFEVLDTPEDQRDPYMSEDLLAFPYVNGGLYSKDTDIVIPQFTDQIRLDLLLEASQKFNWSKISPTIFGAVFESTLNPETRRAGGMHYTSIENIHKVIDPLFLNDLTQELEDIEGERVEKRRKVMLQAFQLKLASLNIFDPACGSGNFLTESYLSLRNLENRVIESLQGDQVSFDVDTESLIKVSISQFYGIEINDFAVSVAKTALWIAEEQMMEATQEIVLAPFDFLPLKSNSNIHEGNALRMDWSEVLPAEKCSFICGNPPFVGSSLRTKEQTDDMGVIAFSGEKKWGKVDYCGAWHHSAALYSESNRGIRISFVSTNSLCQGEQVEPMWRSLFNRGISIDFAWKPFVWDSEANDKAHVHCVIVGFGFAGLTAKPKKLFDESSSSPELVDNINGYLSPAPNVFVPARGKALDCFHRDIVQGCKPVDGGNLVIQKGEYDRFVEENPSLAKYLRPYIGSAEFLNGKDRWCLWLKGIPEQEIADNGELCRRLKLVSEMRMKSPTEEFRRFADRPMLFVQDRHIDSNQLLIPQVSSGRRYYAPVGFVTSDVIISNLAYSIPNATLYDFGLISSLMHNAWMRVICGRLKSDYRYAPVVYNSFSYPDNDENRSAIEECAQAVLDARKAHASATLARLYDPDKMPADLLAAHKALDAAVEEAYGVDFDSNEEKIVAHLFKLYAQATATESNSKK